jgi:acyl-CoA thioester hydrolase
MSIETYRGFVYPWEIDHVGHMNVQFYVRKYDEASWHFLLQLGLGPKWLEEHHRGMVALEQKIRYQREVLAGTCLKIETTLLEIAEKTMRYVHRMVDCEASAPVSEMELLIIQIDTDRRKSVALPANVVERGREWLKKAESEG